MQPLGSRWLALAAAAVLTVPSIGSAQEQGTDKMATLKAAVTKVAPTAVQAVQQKVGGGSSGSSSGTAGKVVDTVKQAAAPAPQQQGTNPTLTQRAVGAAKQLASKRQAQPSQPAPTPATSSSAASNNWPPNMPVNMPRPAAPAGGSGGGGGAPPP